MLKFRMVENFSKEGISFFDIQAMLLDPQHFEQTIDRLAKLIPNEPVKLVALESRGFVFAAPLAYSLGLPLVLARKKGKLPPPVVGQSYGLEYGQDIIELSPYSIAPGDQCVIIDDILATGGTIAAVEQLIEQLGATVKCSVVLLKLAELRGIEKCSYPVYTLEIGRAHV